MIYVASSWRNLLQPKVVHALRDAGLEVYDFQNPAPGNHGFSWSEIDPYWEAWTPEQFRQALEHPIARAGFKTDMAALEAASTVVLVMPCGRSAYLEAGFAAGRQKHLAILLANGEPELMYSMADLVTASLADLIHWCLDNEDGRVT